MVAAASIPAEALAGPLFAAALVLVVAGLAKLRDPFATADLLAVFRVPRPLAAARGFGALELVTGLAVIAVPGRLLASSVAALYLAFALVAAYLVAARVPLASCGCFGREDTSPGALHVLLSIAVAGAAAAAGAFPPPRLDTLLPSLPLAGAPFVVGVLAAAAGAVLVCAYLPRLASSYEPRVG